MLMPKKHDLAQYHFFQALKEKCSSQLLSAFYEFWHLQGLEKNSRVLQQAVYLSFALSCKVYVLKATAFYGAMHQLQARFYEIIVNDHNYLLKPQALLSIQAYILLNQNFYPCVFL